MVDLTKPCHVVPSFFPSFHSQEITNVVTFSRYQVMYNVSFVALCAEVIRKWYFVIQQQSKEQNEALELWLLPALLQIDALFSSKQDSFYSLFLNLSTLLCCTDLEISHS